MTSPDFFFHLFTFLYMRQHCWFNNFDIIITLLLIGYTIKLKYSSLLGYTSFQAALIHSCCYISGSGGGACFRRMRRTSSRIIQPSVSHLRFLHRILMVWSDPQVGRTRARPGLPRLRPSLGSFPAVSWVAAGAQHEGIKAGLYEPNKQFS